MHFPNRHDYVDWLLQEGAINSEQDLIESGTLSESVYLDWLRRGQVGCVFAQLLGRSRNRSQVRTVAFNKPARSQAMADVLASDINEVVKVTVDESGVEAISLLLTAVLTDEDLVRLILSLSALPRWQIEQEWPWRGTLTLIGLRFSLSDEILAEVLGVGPFQLLPPTRQCPVTSLEIRTKPERAIRRGRLLNKRASHLAQIPIPWMSSSEFRDRFTRWTPWLRRRILGGNKDSRAKARITFSVPTAIWTALKAK